MFYWEKVKKNNNVIFNTIKNEVNNKKLSHAFILSGETHVEIEDTWKFMVETLISSDPFTDNVRTLGTYPDLEIIDGTKETIKKENVINVMSKLNETPLDSQGVKILVLKGIENANKQSLNSLLKFIEEPLENTYILMTTVNLNKVLSTIKSRAQIFTIKPKTIASIVSDLEEKNYPYPKIYANILSSNVALPDEKDAKKYVLNIEEILNMAIENNTKWVNKLFEIYNRKNYQLISILLIAFFNDIWKHKANVITSFGDRDLLEKYSSFNYTNGIFVVGDFLNEMNANVNIDVALPAMLIKIGDLYE